MESASLTSELTYMDRAAGAVYGMFIGDALAMPVHWYYNTNALKRDYGHVTDFMKPRNPHPDSILWRSSYTPPKKNADILHDQSKYWGKRGIHYHQFLKAGENTLNLKLAGELLLLLGEQKQYSENKWLDRFVKYMTTPGCHEDTDGPSMMSGGKIIAKIVLDVLNSTSLKDAIAAHFTDGKDGRSKQSFESLFDFPDEAVVGKHFSSACYMEHSIPATLFLALKYSENPEQGLIANTMCGGDNAGRGAVLGALLGAEGGLSCWPERWINGLLNPPEIFVLNARS